MAALVRLILLAVCLWTASDTVFAQISGNLNIGVNNPNVETTVTITSRNGCREVLRCTGNGTSLEWKRVGSRSPLMSGGNKQITTTRTPTDVEGRFSFVSDLVFDPIEIVDAGMWKCTIDSLTYTADLSIEADLASPMPSHHNLSDRFIEDNLAVLCPVESCISNVSVHLLRVGGEIIETQFIALPNTPQFNLMVMEDLVGRYVCRVTVNIMGMEQSFEEVFNITGTPLPRPTTQPTSADTGGGNGGGNGGGGGGGGTGGGGGSAQSTMHSHTHAITLGLVILLMALLLY